MATLILDLDSNVDVEQLVSDISLMNGINKVSLLDDDDWDNWSDEDETNFLDAIPGMREKIIEGMNTPFEECVPIEEVLPGWKYV